MIRHIALMSCCTGLVACIGLWCASYGRPHGFGLLCQSSEGLDVLACARGRISASRFILNGGQLELQWFVGNSETVKWWGPYDHLGWFKSIGPGQWVVQVPFYALVVPLAGLTGVLFLPVYRRRRRARLGQCLDCGYDLRGTAQTCPECGAAINDPEHE